MGLDISLHKCPDFDAARKAEAAAEAETTALWATAGAYEKLSVEAKAHLQHQAEEIATRHGLSSSYGSFASVESIELPSRLYPEHLFKVGYLRSSYNGSGINSVLRRRGVPDLYSIFQPPEDEYHVRCDWAAVKERVAGAITQFKAIQAGPTGQVDVTCISHNSFIALSDLPSSEAAVMDIMAEHLSRSPSFGNGGYSCREGHFYPGGMKIRAVVPGAVRGFSGELEPCAYVVFDKEAKGENDWHLQALRIVEETVDYVLAQPNPEHFYLAWSA